MIKTLNKLIEDNFLSLLKDIFFTKPTGNMTPNGERLNIVLWDGNKERISGLTTSV